VSVCGRATLIVSPLLIFLLSRAERERDGEKGRGQRTRERKIQRGIKRRQREPEEISKKKV